MPASCTSRMPNLRSVQRSSGTVGTASFPDIHMSRERQHTIATCCAHLQQQQREPRHRSLRREHVGTEQRCTRH